MIGKKLANLRSIEQEAHHIRNIMILLLIDVLSILNIENSFYIKQTLLVALKIEKIAYEIEEQGYFDPKNVIDTRQRVETEIA